MAQTPKPDVTCRKCGATGFSKCPALRSIFCQQQAEATYGDLMVVEHEEEDYPEGSMGANSGDKKHTTVVSFHFPGKLDDEKIATYLREMGQYNTRMIVCDHAWEWTATRNCDFRCHKGTRSKARERTNGRAVQTS